VAWLSTFVLCVLAVAGAAASAASDWEAVREGRIDPLNSMLHSHLPEALAERNLQGLERFYTQELRADARARYRAILDTFAEIDRVDLRIDRVAWGEESEAGVPATVRLLVRGRGPEPESALRQLLEKRLVRVRFYDPFWEITEESVESTRLVERATPRFDWRTASAGVADIHANAESPPFRLFGGASDNPVLQGSGVAVADVDGDGCEDLLLAGSPNLTLRRSLCDGTFRDITAESGLPNPYPAGASGVVFFDYDGDARPDLFVAAVEGGDRLFRNEGGGRFRDVTAAAGIPARVWSIMPVVADYDRDGDADIYIVGGGDHQHGFPRPSWDAVNGTRGALLQNQGDGTFLDVARAAGVASPGWDLAAGWADYDGDGFEDLYVANEFGSNRFYRNEGDGTFSDRTQETGTADGGSGMGVAWGDYDGDGDPDLYVSGMRANSGWALFHPEFPAPIPWWARLIRPFTPEVERRTHLFMDRLTRGSTLYRNEGDGSFRDVSDEAGVRDAQWAWSTQFLDFDNDGDLDLYAVNGFVSGPVLDDL
jgi:hypothetical protein